MLLTSESKAVENQMFVYAIRDKATKMLINRKAHSSNSFYLKRYFAEQKMIENKEEIVKFQLVEINT